MTQDEKIALLEETFAIDKGTLKPDAALDSFEQWDSLGVLILIVMFEDDFSKTITADDIEGFDTVQDVLDPME